MIFSQITQLQKLFLLFHINNSINYVSIHLSTLDTVRLQRVLQDFNIKRCHQIEYQLTFSNRDLFHIVPHSQKGYTNAT